MEKQKNKSSKSIVIAIINGVFAVIAAVIATGAVLQLNLIQNQAQQVNVNVINTLGERTASGMNISENSDIGHVTSELTQALLILEQNNAKLQSQVNNLKEFILDRYSGDEVNVLVENGYVRKTAPVRLDALDFVDGERCEKVDAVKDLYGTTHSASYKMKAYNDNYAWAKFKLDSQYDSFTANIVTSSETDRDACMCVEIYVDGTFVSRVDDVVRDEAVRPIRANVIGGNVLEIRVIRLGNTAHNICFISDSELTKIN